METKKIQKAFPLTEKVKAHYWGEGGKAKLPFPLSSDTQENRNSIPLEYFIHFYLFETQNDKEKQREKASICWFTPQMASISRG